MDFCHRSRMIHGDMKLAQVLLKRPVALQTSSTSSSANDAHRSTPVIHIKVAGNCRNSIFFAASFTFFVSPLHLYSSLLFRASPPFGSQLLFSRMTSVFQISETAVSPFVTAWTAAMQAPAGEILVAFV
jgi:hypothetical protein